MTLEQILDKLQELNADEQEKVLAFIDSLESQKHQIKHGSKLGKKLRAIRQEIIDSGLPLLTAKEADIEKAERRGGYGEDLR
ncbi:hypothetical protein [Nostoc sp. FACHB-280]|uniref:hypothetical protein n=1 Tax=Nostoc sp. FACHB-280 TaxID=2692839 RepID=UPI00168AA158|nr:hypothetical protein [Nostoc sp. FACHB-280]MBD2498313.1 hypothetical protein [Nostoc sp. FACHB-280]